MTTTSSILDYLTHDAIMIIGFSDDDSFFTATRTSPTQKHGNVPWAQVYNQGTFLGWVFMFLRNGPPEGYRCECITPLCYGSVLERTENTTAAAVVGSNYLQLEENQASGFQFWIIFVFCSFITWTFPRRRFRRSGVTD